MGNKGVRKSLAFEVKTLLYIFRENSGSVTIHSRAVSPNIGFYVYFLLAVMVKFVCPIVKFARPIVKFARLIVKFARPIVEFICPIAKFARLIVKFARPIVRSSQNLASITSPRFCQNFQKLQNVHAAVEALF